MMHFPICFGKGKGNVLAKQGKGKKVNIMNMFGILVALGLYAQTFVVTDVVTTPATETTTETVIIICEDFNGNEWEIETDDGDWFKGDIITAILDTKGTDTIYDDEVVCAQYSGYIEGWEMLMLEQIEHEYE